MKMKVVALAGGTGSAKLLRGLSRAKIDLTVVANVGDNFWAYGLLVCPDVDIAMYTLAGIADRERGWGIAGDTFAVLSQLGRLGAETWFRLGDMDMAASLLRTGYLRRGLTLTQATAKLAERLGVNDKILPATDDSLQTYVRTPRGLLHLQEFWVREKGRPRPIGVEYRGASRAKPTRDVGEALARADRVIVCPANPITSIGPMLAMRGFERLLSRAGGRVVALSPMVGKKPFSGPAGKLMKAEGLRPDSAGVARRYSRFLDAIVIDRGDIPLAEEIERTRVSCVLSDTRMRSLSDGERLARELLRA
jgi:LPPG:FO 2-phospho-L-lactate transferase